MIEFFNKLSNISKEIVLYIGISILVIAITFLLSITSGGSIASHYIADYIYDRTSSEQGECVVIGIDGYALEELGGWPWTRDVMADLIDLLNMDPENKPAAIGIDVLYIGSTTEYADDRLAESIAESDNVILACSANFDSQLTLNEDGIYIMDDFQISSMNMPYSLLGGLTGHINAMYDYDGILRHHLWSLNYEGETIYSLPYQAYLLWCENQGIEADFEPITDDNGFWYLEYSRAPGDYYTYSVMDIFEGTYDPEHLKDAIVFIGPYEAGLMDYFITPVERSARMYGVAYLANVVDAMIAGVTKYEVTTGFYLACGIILFLYSVILLEINVYKGIMLYLISNIASFMGYLVAYELGYVIEPLTLLIGYLIGLVASLIYHYLSENKKRKYITSVFNRYVDEDIIKQLLKEDSQVLGLEGKECNIAIMFVDIRGFTTLSENMQPIEIVKMLNKYLTLTSTCIKNHDGVLDKFIGDATMAFWGAPIPCEDSVYKACQAALEMVKKAKEFDTDGASFGIGIHYGKAVVGNIGTVDRMDFTAIGNVVNTAQRIEGVAPKQTIYVSDLVATMLKGRAIMTPLDMKLPLKGKSEPMQLYILKDLL